MTISNPPKHTHKKKFKYRLKLIIINLTFEENDIQKPQNLLRAEINNKLLLSFLSLNIIPQVSDDDDLTVHPESSVVDPGDVHADGRYVRVASGSASGARGHEGRESHEAQCEFLMRSFNPALGPDVPGFRCRAEMRCYTRLTVYTQRAQ